MSSVNVKEVIGKTTVEDSRTKTTVVEDEHVGKALVTSKTLNIGVSLSRTINLGNYENTKLSVSLNCPCELGEQDDVYEFVLGWCDTKLGSLVDACMDGGK